MLNNLILQRLQCAHILSILMNFHTQNAYCGAVTNFYVSIFLIKKQITSIHKQHLQLGFTLIISILA